MSAPCVLHALDRTGDTELTWDPDQSAEVADAREMFTALKRRATWPTEWTVRNGK